MAVFFKEEDCHNGYGRATRISACGFNLVDLGGQLATAANLMTVTYGGAQYMVPAQNMIPVSAPMPMVNQPPMMMQGQQGAPQQGLAYPSQENDTAVPQASP